MASMNHLASPSRADSLRSISSTNSNVSLTRRPRIRSRSGTTSSQRGKSRDQSPENLNYDELAVAYPQQPGPSSQNNAPPRPAKSPYRISASSATLSLSPAPTSSVQRPSTTDSSRGRNTGRRNSKDTKRPCSMPREGCDTVSSDSSSQLSPVTPGPNSDLVMGGRMEASNRDSFLSQESASSSIYPPSTASNYDRSPSPPSRKGKERADGIPSFQVDDHAYHDFDADDVSLRLRLLVKNSYYLPPAHSKPSAADLAGMTTAPKKQPKAPSPSFLDIFRIGKPKSKPTTPISPNFTQDSAAPKLRTASDSPTTMDFRIPPSPQIQITRAPPPPQGRVVVVREKMDDLMTAAKISDLETRARVDSTSHPGVQSKKLKEEVFDGYIDPTDSVDLPPPSNDYPFDLQASALQGLGVLDSVGAAALAAGLPPHSPGMWSLTTQEESWRKDILQQAVGHSFSSTPDSSFRGKSSARTGSTSTSGNAPTTRSTTSSPPIFAQPILPPELLNRHVQHSPSLSRRDDVHGTAGSDRKLHKKGSAPDFHNRPRNSFNPPLRAETPVVPLTPLTPAPRKYIVNPVYSLSQSDLDDPVDGDLEPIPASPRCETSPSSSKGLSDVYESHVNTGRSVITPPPVVIQGPGISAVNPFKITSRSESAGSHYFDDEDDDEPWTEPSRFSSTRPSFAERAHPSPTVSAFRDAIYIERSMSPFPDEQLEDLSSEPVSFVSAMSGPGPRFSMASPPPRVSSSVVPHALPPLPRAIRRPRSSPDRETFTVFAPDPVTPPYSISKRRGQNVTSLHIPAFADPPAIKSAPPNSSISFFDNIQSNLNDMDGYSSDSSDDDDPLPSQEVTSVFINPRMSAVANKPSFSSLRPALMRLGNNSTPQLGAGPSTGNFDSYPAFDTRDIKGPVVNVPAKPAFFSSKKSSKGKQGISALDFVPQSRSPSISTSRSSKSSDGRKRSGSSGAKSQKSEYVTRPSQDESFRALDGMVARHLEAERDTLKRIAASSRAKS